MVDKHSQDNNWQRFNRWFRVLSASFIQMNPRSSANRLIAGLSLATITALSTLSLAGCAAEISDPVEEKSATTIADDQFGYSQQDLMFAQMMIPHHEQALEMSMIALEVSQNEKVLAIAQKIFDGQDPEIQRMKSWLSSPSASVAAEEIDHEAMGHGSGEMAGMATYEQIDQLAELATPEFDKLFLELMIAHHEGALEMASLIENSRNAEARTLAEEIVTAQKQEISEMKKLLKELTDA
jgi:uncharacterized protein (DUF305 family)